MKITITFILFALVAFSMAFRMQTGLETETELEQQTPSYGLLFLDFLRCYDDTVDVKAFCMKILELDERTCIQRLNQRGLNIGCNYRASNGVTHNWETYKKFRGITE